ncbi:jg7112 [Pararge aegeria aegeria]|uniref:Jg7112 protein n=1 Tax=Pararge aegeria aegeria TaxID=348720 RepID=A0A8S4QT85_9NEOP|nr:jg7112 [Pararge aegeria aegeria]
MIGAHSSENRWTLGFQGVGMATPLVFSGSPLAISMHCTRNEIDSSPVGTACQLILYLESHDNTETKPPPEA